LSLTTTCAWTATANVPWITVTSPSGTGNATIAFGVAVNTGMARSGTISVGSATATITQAACTYALHPGSLGVPAAASAESLSLTTPCAWTATADVPWITVTSPSGTGNATIAFAVALNTGLERSGTISVGSATARITQAAAPLMATYSGTASGTHNFEVSGALSLGPGSYTMTFNRAGTIYVHGVAGGGGGGGGKRRDDGGSSTGGGGGGGGGAANLSGQSLSVVSGTTYAAVVGSGGSGGAGATEASGNNAENGAAGTETSFRIQGGTIYLQLGGGSGGGGGTAATGAGGAGGTTGAGVGATGGGGGNGGGNFGLVAPQPGGGIAGVSTGGGGGGGQSNEQSSTAGGAQGGQGGASGGAGGSGARGGNGSSGTTDSGAGGEGARDNNGDDSAGGGGGGGKGITVPGGPSNRGGGGGGGGAINTSNSSDRGGNGGAGANGGMSIGLN